MYRKVVRDDQGRTIEKAGRLFTDAAEIESDNRTLPGEAPPRSYDNGPPLPAAASMRSFRSSA